MPRTDPSPQPRPGRFGRRDLLAGSAALVGAGLAGCTPAASPGPDRPGPTSASPARSGVPSPTRLPALPGATAAARSELGLAAAAARLARRAEGGRRTSLGRVADGHAEHAEVLLGPDPPRRVRSTGRSPSTPPAARSVDGLLEQYGRRAADYRRRAVAAAGPAALLWGSLAVAAVGYAAAVSSSSPVRVGPAGAALAPVVAVPAVEALTGLLRQVPALAYAHQVALGRLTGAAAGASRARLADLGALRDDLAARLRRTGAAVPAPEAAYELPGPVADRADAVRLLRTVESAFLPHCGLWLSAADGADRGPALATLTATAAAARKLGAALPPWPGWP